MPLTAAPIFPYSPQKNMLPLLGQKKSKALPLLGSKNRRESVAFTWVLPLLIKKN